MASIDSFHFTDIQGRQQPLAQWRGHVLLMVNVASRCGFTPQYGALEALWQRHRDQGVVVVGFPCNQFGGQEPGSNAQIASFCQLDYGVSFPLAARVEVNGPGADPLWQWLQREKRGVLGTSSIKWNFTKFLVGRDGQVLGRYAPNTRPEQLEGDILAALAR